MALTCRVPRGQYTYQSDRPAGNYQRRMVHTFQAPLPVSRPLKPALKPARKVVPSPELSIERPSERPPSRRELLTDSLSCIFTRRNNQQRKIPLKRVYYDEKPQEAEPPKEVSDTESAIDKSKTFDVPLTAPDPPRISQPTPDIRMEDWFAAKQRILANVKPEVVPNEPFKVRQEVKYPEAHVDPHGFDIEPPSVLKKNVSPYVPSHSHEREEYEKYKSEKITLAMLQQRYAQPEEAATYETVYEGNEEYEGEDMEKYHIEREGYGFTEEEQYRQQENAPEEQQYYQFSDTAKESQSVSTQNMCHKCSFQTTNSKKLRDHLKFVHGEDHAGSTNDLYSRREGQQQQEELFTRRGEQPKGGATARFKRRNTVLVNIVSHDAEDTPRGEVENSAKEQAGVESGVMAALEYFESTKDQPRKTRPYKRTTEQLDKEWI